METICTTCVESAFEFGHAPAVDFDNGPFFTTTPPACCDEVHQLYHVYTVA